MVSILRSLFFVGATTPHAIRSPRLQSHISGNVKRLVGVVWSSRILSGCGDLRIVKELHRYFFLLLRLRDGCGLLDPFDDFRSQSTTSDRLREERQRTIDTV
jgi:hypothetical protein